MLTLQSDLIGATFYINSVVKLNHMFIYQLEWYINYEWTRRGCCSLIVRFAVLLVFGYHISITIPLIWCQDWFIIVFVSSPASYYCLWVQAAELLVGVDVLINIAWNILFNLHYFVVEIVCCLE